MSHRNIAMQVYFPEAVTKFACVISDEIIHYQLWHYHWSIFFGHPIAWIKKTSISEAGFVSCMLYEGIHALWSLIDKPGFPYVQVLCILTVDTVHTPVTTLSTTKDGIVHTDFYFEHCKGVRHGQVNLSLLFWYKQLV